MLLQPVRTSSRALRRTTYVPEPRVAVLLNANARKVNEKVVRALSHVVPADDLFISRSPLDARRIARTVLERRYHTVFCGGGDGTFVTFTNEILNLAGQRGYGRAAVPRFGVLKLGTGNGLASVVNASPLSGEGIVDDVLRARANEVPSYRSLELLQIDGRRAQFAGMGLDGRLLNDYVWMRENLGKGPLRKWTTGETGYFASIAFKTVPYYLLNSAMVEAEVINRGGKAYRLGERGQIVEEIEPGALLYKGPVMSAAAGTIPFYGFQFAMFPFAGQRRGMMHLRLARVRAPEVLANLTKLWRGKWFAGGKILDFHASDVELKLAKPMPFQIGGDAAGYRDQLRFQMSPDRVELVDFSGSVH